MVYFIYGRTGSGKSAHMLRHASMAGGKHIFVLVPDRAAVLAEKMFAGAPNAGDIDVVTFRRLSNFVFRRYGGICENYISKGAKKVIMHNTLSSLSGFFSTEGSYFDSDTAATERFMSMRTELARGAVTPELLARAAEACGGETGKKFGDISLLFTAFDAEVGVHFADPDGILARMNALLAENDFFSGCDVYLDSFNSFSKEQLITLREIMRSADNVYISVPCVPGEDDDVPCFYGISDTARRLLDVARDANAEQGKPTVLRACARYENDEMAILAKNLFPGKGCTRVDYEEEPACVRVMSAANVFAESEAVSIISVCCFLIFSTLTVTSAPYSIAFSITSPGLFV